MNIQEIITEIQASGITLDRISEELDYRDMAGINENETHCGWDDALYFYSGAELATVEEMLERDKNFKEEHNGGII